MPTEDCGAREWKGPGSPSLGAGNCPLSYSNTNFGGDPSKFTRLQRGTQKHVLLPAIEILSKTALNLSCHSANPSELPSRPLIPGSPGLGDKAEGVATALTTAHEDPAAVHLKGQSGHGESPEYLSPQPCLLALFC